MKIYANGGWRQPSSAKLRISGTWRTITRAQIYTGGAWKTAVQFTSTLGVSVSPVEQEVLVDGNPYGYGSTTITATPSGGLGPYTYSWAVTGFSGSTPYSLGNPNLATVTVNGGSHQGSSSDVVTLQVTVTDSLAQTASTYAVVLFTNIWGL